MKRVVLAICAVLTALAMVGAIVSGSVIYSLMTGHSRYAEQSFAASAQAYDVARHTMPDGFGRWSAYLGAGTAEVRAGALNSAINKLSAALDLVVKDTDADLPHGVVHDEDYTDECKVRINLSIAHALDGERLSQAGRAKDAQRAYDQAATTVQTCADQGEKAKELFEQATEKAEKEGNKAQSQEKAKETPQGEKQQDTGKEPGDELKDEELRKRAKEVEQQRRVLQELEKDFGSTNGENW
ncbi:hypothetical protein [Trueperella pecoris]|uniref:Uncharacterized protein n=1 Tax=Trueperella pecoris TaxID=2733571 RepID=A0A7M1QWT3_9ACTO|nr:hypothetical protein [Trueperella pecoris]QOR45805.1 hypothetical protein INS88_00770 [Trueperella pecoris]QTG75634.1 hypothetical protein J4179_00705 [Trueperella pecoris]